PAARGHARTVRARGGARGGAADADATTRARGRGRGRRSLHGGRVVTVLTPTVRSAARRWRFWAAFAIIAIVVALVTFIGAGANRPLGVPLDPASPGPVGAKALAQVLGEQGVEVTITASLDDTRAAV